MREIKYRQHLGNGNWHYWGYLKEGEFTHPLVNIEEKSPSQQYTGLKDRNGEDIYEGDVVRMQQIQGIGEFVGVIHIGPDPARPYDCRVWVDTSHEEKARKHGIGGKYVFIHNEPEVIGNVHENPELTQK